MTNVRYLSGFRGSSAFILLTKTKNIFVTDFRYKDEVEKEFAGWDVLIDTSGRIKTLKRLVGSLGLRSLAFESSISYDFFRHLSGCGVRLVPLGNMVEHIRAEKDHAEITSIKEAIRRAEAAFGEVRPLIKAGKRERYIALLLEEKLKKRGCSGIPFDIIVASGVNAARPHAQATEKKLAAGDLVVIDWGGEADGYLSDMTRTLLLKGREGMALAKKKEIYMAVLKANRKAIGAVRAGIEAKVIDTAARDIIKKAGYDKCFGHGTGHGVGLEVHEFPPISWTKKDVIRENMVFTIEPGIYIGGLGGVRIEDMVLARQCGHEVLTKLPRKLEII